MEKIKLKSIVFSLVVAYFVYIAINIGIYYFFVKKAGDVGSLFLFFSALQTMIVGTGLSVYMLFTAFHPEWLVLPILFFLLVGLIIITVIKRERNVNYMTHILLFANVAVTWYAYKLMISCF